MRSGKFKTWEMMGTLLVYSIVFVGQFASLVSLENNMLEVTKMQRYCRVWEKYFWKGRSEFKRVSFFSDTSDLKIEDGYRRKFSKISSSKQLFYILKEQN